VRRLGAVWQVIEEGDRFLWFGCKDNEFTIESRSEWLSLLGQLASSIDRLVIISEYISNVMGVNKPSNISQVSWLIKVGDHLNRSSVPKAGWLTSNELERLFKEAEKYKAICSNYWVGHSALSQHYQDAFFLLPLGTLLKVKTAWASTSAMLSSSDAEGKLLLENGHRLLDFLDYAQLFIKDCSTDITELANYFGFNNENITISRAWEISQLAILCNSKVRPVANWLNPPNLQQVNTVVEQIRPDYEEFNRKRSYLLTRYDESFFELDIDELIKIFGRLKERGLSASLSELYNLCEKILSCSTTKPNALIGLTSYIREWLADIAQIGQLLGFQVEGITMERGWEFGQLATLCGSEVWIEANWLNPVSLQQVRNLIKQIRPDYEEYCRRKQNLLTSYDESFLELKFDQLIESFSGAFHTSFLRWLNPAFYRNKKSILRTSRMNKLPSSILEDLLKGRELIRLHKQLDPHRERVRAMLGGYDRGYQTDFDLVEKAINNATDIIRLAGVISVPDNLIKTVTLGGASSSLIAIGNRILNATQRWEQTHQELLSLIPFDDLIKANDLIHLRRKIETNREQVKLLLNGYYNGFNTDFNLVQEAMNVAAKAIKLVGANYRPEILARVIAIGTVPRADIHALGQQFINSIQRWEQALQEFNTFIPERCLPGVELPLRHTTLVRVEEWLKELSNNLSELCELTDLLLSLCRDKRPLDLYSLLAQLRKNEELIQIQVQIENESEFLQQKFGKRYKGLKTDWNDILLSLEWTRKAHELFGIRTIPQRFIQLAAGGDKPDSSFNESLLLLSTNYKEILNLISVLEQHFETSVLNSNILQILPFIKLKNRAMDLQQHIDDLQFWIIYKNLKQQFSNAEFEGFLSQIQKNPPQSSQLISAFNKSIYQAWINSIYEQEPILKDFSGQHHEQVIDEFREVDKRLIQLSSQRIIEQCNAWRPRAISFQAKDKEFSVLMREAAKKRKHLPVRDLFDRIASILPCLKPCFLMSPLSVSQFLQPERLKFDLVIFDEASQVFTEDAVGAIYRGSQLVIAGDEKQLPPTDFFKSLDSDDDTDEDQIDETSSDFESVLNQCGAVPGIPDLFLRWHYRSRHESLIAFSNHHFYNNRLVTFPSAQYKHESLGVKFIHVQDGIYDRGGKRDNKREAEVIAAQVLKHFAHYPQKSIGVVAFSQAQMMAIEDVIERQRQERPELEKFFKDDRLEGFFIKNLENVQGDERDVIILSVGYGYDQQRRFTMHFGPLNKPGGERRLNVAITRARERVILVSSIRAADIKLTAVQPKGGVWYLHHYLDYAERGEDALQLSTPQGNGESESPLEEEVAAEIRRLGYDVIPQVGCSGYRIDIGVVDPSKPGSFLLGVECDGATYHSASTARDRDRLRQYILENLGWRLHRIWSPNWVSRREAEITRLKQAIEVAKKEAIKKVDSKIAEYATATPDLPFETDLFGDVKTHPPSLSQLKPNVLKGHTDVVNSVAFSPNGYYCLSGSSDTTIRLWDLRGGNEINRLLGHSRAVNSVAFSPDGCLAVSGGGDGRVFLWEVQSGRKLLSFGEYKERIFKVAFSLNGNRALSGGADGVIRLWNVESGEQIRYLEGHEGSVYTVAFSPDGFFALSGGADYSIRLWDLKRKKEICKFIGHKGMVYSVSISPSGTNIISGSSDGTVRLWETETSREIYCFQTHALPVNSVNFSNDGSLVLSAGADNIIRLWDFNNRREIYTFKEHTDAVESVAFSPDGKYALSGSRDRTIRLLELP
jgi:superfamily I DNA and/or RNA helicase